MDAEKKLIGRAEPVTFPELGFTKIPTRIDTGAKTSSIWASSVIKRGGRLDVVFFSPKVPQYTGVTQTFTTFDSTMVASSTGHVQARYKVQLLVSLGGKRIRAWFTLADRSTQVYPVLIGRNVLSGKFIVDVKKGHILKDEERRRSETLKSQLEHPEEEES